MRQKPVPTGRETSFGEDEIIVSKTNLTGKIVYCNKVFIRVAGYTEAELIGAPHSIIRHPDMPRAVFKLLWDTIQAKQEIFAYVLNMDASGNGYWVLAHVTPSLSDTGEIVGYHSNRRKPSTAAVEKVRGLYRDLVAIEKAPPSRKDGMVAAYDELVSRLTQMKLDYDEFVLSL